MSRELILDASSLKTSESFCPATSYSHTVSLLSLTLLFTILKLNDILDRLIIPSTTSPSSSSSIITSRPSIHRNHLNLWKNLRSIGILVSFFWIVIPFSVTVFVLYPWLTRLSCLLWHSHHVSHLREYSLKTLCQLLGQPL